MAKKTKGKKTTKTVEEVIDTVVGPIGTPERVEFDSKVDSHLKWMEEAAEDEMPVVIIETTPEQKEKIEELVEIITITNLETGTTASAPVGYPEDITFIEGRGFGVSNLPPKTVTLTNATEEEIEQYLNSDSTLHSYSEEISYLDAIERVTKELREDPKRFVAFKDNIAMSFKDEYQRFKKSNSGPLTFEHIHEIANNAAFYFLSIFIK